MLQEKAEKTWLIYKLTSKHSNKWIIKSLNKNIYKYRKIKQKTGKCKEWGVNKVNVII